MRKYTGRYLALLLLAVIPGGAWAGEVDGSDGNAKNELMIVLGPSLPLGSQVFNQDHVMGASIRAIGHRQVSAHTPELSIGLEVGMDLMAGWYDGGIMSFPILVDVRYDLVESKRGRFAISPFGGLGVHYHKVVFQIDGVDVKRQLRPSAQIGLNARQAISAGWAMNLRSTYTRSFTSKQVAETAGMTIRSPDRYGYGSLVVTLGLSRCF
jgi:hypothetical protein